MNNYVLLAIFNIRTYLNHTTFINFRACRKFIQTKRLYILPYVHRNTTANFIRSIRMITPLDTTANKEERRKIALHGCMIGVYNI